MNETSRGIGRVVVLVLFTVLFVAAWRSDHPARGRIDTTLSRNPVPQPTVSMVGVSAASIGEALSSCAAARLVPADQTIGLTLHADHGVSAALHSAFPTPLVSETSRRVVADVGRLLGVRLVTIRRTSATANFGFAPDAAILGGTWNGLSHLPSPQQTHAHIDGKESESPSDADAAGMDATASVVR